LVSGAVDDEALGMFVVHGAREHMPVAYEDGDYKVQPMRIEQW
jgi:hypothetical protein